MVPPVPPKDPSSGSDSNLESVYDPTSIDPRFSAKTTTPPAPIRTRYDSEEDDDDDLIYTSVESRRDPSRKHTSTPSTAPLLPQDSATSSRTRLDGERTAEAESEIEEAGFSNGRVANDWMSRTRAFFDRNNGFILIGCSQAFFASINTLVKLLQERVAVPVWQVILVRMSVTWVGCIIYMHYAKIEHPFLGPPGVRLLLCARGFVGFGGLFGVYYSLRYLSLSDATVLTFLAPVLVGVLASVTLHEAYSRTEALTGLASLGGVVLIAKPSFLFSSTNRAEELGPAGQPITPEQRSSAVVLALAGVFGAAGAYLLIRKIGKRANALHSIAFFSIYCVIVSSVYPLFVDSPPVVIFDIQFFALIIPIGILGFIAQILLTLGLQREKAGRGTLAVYSNLLFAMILERLVFGKLPDAWSLLGSAIIVGGAVYVVMEKEKAKGVDAAPGISENPEGKAEEGRKIDDLDVEMDELDVQRVV